MMEYILWWLLIKNNVAIKVCLFRLYMFSDLRNFCFQALVAYWPRVLVLRLNSSRVKLIVSVLGLSQPKCKSHAADEAGHSPWEAAYPMGQATWLCRTAVAQEVQKIGWQSLQQVQA